ncbi:hypothetical protein [Rathayibacter sp. AY1A7]|uniref:hypothetical protein n=1 Tax=Rathayibacter sp. AY1A7 TaxID=2080524 RepID=UPI0011AFF4A9|nr:hypothetical protein [Rathayibacter sp. AY1A7]
MTEEQSEAGIQQANDSSWEAVSAQNPGIARPEVERVRVVKPAEWAGAMVGCLDAAGFAAEEIPDGGITSSEEIPTAQNGAYALALFECQAAYPVDPRYTIPLNTEQIDYLYSYYRDSLKPCIEGQGYEVPDVPSREVFSENFDVDGGWDIYSTVISTASADEWYALKEKCPQFPDELYG